MSHRPLLIGGILSLALLAEWGLERIEDGGKRLDTRGESARVVARRAGALGSLASAGAAHLRRLGGCCGPLIAPGLAGAALAAVTWVLLPPLLLYPTSLLTPLFDWRCRAASPGGWRARRRRPPGCRAPGDGLAECSLAPAPPAA